MAAAAGVPITFVVSGTAEGQERGAPVPGAAAPPLPAGLIRGRLKQTVRVAAQRGAGTDVRVTAIPGEDVVVLHLAGGPALVLHPENARDLLRAQRGSGSRRGGGDADNSAAGEIRIPTSLQWEGLGQTPSQRGGERGSIGGVLLSAIDIVTGAGTGTAADFAASEVVRRVDAQVDPGVYRLSPHKLPKLKDTASPLKQMDAAPGGRPLLVLAHGTFSETSGSFAKLWDQHPQRVTALFAQYEQRVFALDHPTLGVSPIENALTLVLACPRGARLHLLTHSRGGLVAEVLARICARPGLDAGDFAFFKGEPYRKQREALKALGEVVAQRKIRVDRVVRVACPARGTLLASKRLDAYVSILKWSLELAGVPVAPAIVDFLGEVAQRRADPELLPGLAAQIPDSPLIKWLHAVDDAIPGELRVIAGDIEGDGVTSWLKTLLADAFFWTDNDLVVQTRSMYGGAPRADGATFVYDQGGTVSHFNYFANDRTAEAVVDALMKDKPPAFRDIGPLSWAGKSPTGVRGPARGPRDATPAGDKPAVFVLPGILGSNLKVDGKRIWLSVHLLNGLMRIKYQPGQPDGVLPDGAIGQTYDDLEAFLAATHEVIEFAYDWRRPMEEEARRLGKAVEAAMAARAQSGQPVRLLAHSMGGLLARTMQLVCPDVWQAMMSRPGARMLMLGTPNDGSWAPMQVLSGDDTFGNALVAIGAPFQDHKARQLMAELPGFIQLQAGLVDATLGLDGNATWQTLADDDLQRVREFSSWHHDEVQLNAYTWGVPPQPVIDQAVALRKRLDAQRDHDLDGDLFKGRMLLVTGKARFTPAGFLLGERGLEYLNAPEGGDGRVTLPSACLPNVPTWQVDCEHGNLPAFKQAFAAFLELLATGTTASLTQIGAAGPSRGGAPTPAETLVRSRPSRSQPSGLPPESTQDVFSSAAAEPAGGAAPRGTALKVGVINGDLLFVRQPLMLGHYTSLRLTGTEAVIDTLLGGAMSASLRAGLYPSAPGIHQIFVNSGANRANPWQAPRPEAAIVVGLGEEGSLRAEMLVQTVRQAVMAWSQRLTEMPGGAPAVFELASTLIGSGGVDIAVGQAATLVVQGVREANERLAAGRWPVVGELHFVELYRDRASEIWRALDAHAASASGSVVLAEAVTTGQGAMPRMNSFGYRGAPYDYVSALTRDETRSEATIVYTLDTRRARTEVRAQAVQSRLVEQLVASASNSGHADPQIGRTLFTLLIPLEMKALLESSTEMQLEVDGGTAGIPWELLDSRAPDSGDARPWALRAKLLRKLRTAGFRGQVADAGADACALVIGEPACPPDYPPLPGARDEAAAVAECLRAPGALGPQRVTALLPSDDDSGEAGADAATVVGTLLGRNWRIVHIAGHGVPPQAEGDPRGVVLSDGIFLGPREIEKMSEVPELVFVNCCHLGARPAAELLAKDALALEYDRARFAAGVAEELIRIGVRCVIAAGWAVDDEAASVFASRFYGALMRDCRFIDAVAEAREAAAEMGGNTWAAYQCYGDPDWHFKREVADAQRPAAALREEFAGVAAAKDLVLALESLAIRSTFQHAKAVEQAAKLRHLEARFGPRWRGIGEVAEAFGRAWDAAGDRAAAIRWYTQALGANDGTASVRAVEQLGNLRARHAWAMAKEAIAARASGDDVAAAKRPAADRGRGRGKATTSRSARTAALDAALASARAELAAALDLLERVAALRPTLERESLCGSAWKRRAMLERAAGKPRDESDAIERMKTHYGAAVQLAREGRGDGPFYPALNLMAAELASDAAKPGWRGFDPDLVADVQGNLARKARDDPDFWSVVGVTELRIYVAIGRRKLAAEADEIGREYDDLHRRMSAQSEWDSVLDQLDFVLPKYQARANAAERNAASDLSKYLAALVGKGRRSR